MTRGQVKLALLQTVLGAAAGFVLAMTTVSPASADYSPRYLYLATLGPGSAYFWDQNTPLTNDGMNAWNWWLQNKLGISPKLSEHACQSPTPCILFANDDEGIIGTNCILPGLASGVYANTVVASGSQNVLKLYDPDCDFGSQTNPVFIVIVDNEYPLWSDYYWRTFAERHEMGHALALKHAEQGSGFTSCWWSTDYPFGGTWYYPVMENGTGSDCPSRPQNIAASWGEMGYVQLWNGWWN